MTTPHKALLRQARDALDNLLACEDKCRCSGRLTIAALQAAIDVPETDFGNMPEPYDQQALELCHVCGWKAIVPGEPCLMCESNAKMLVPEPVPLTQDRAEALAHRRCKRYRMADDAPYQFNAHTLMEFVRDIEGAK